MPPIPVASGYRRVKGQESYGFAAVAWMKAPCGLEPYSDLPLGAGAFAAATALFHSPHSVATAERRVGRGIQHIQANTV